MTERLDSQIDRAASALAGAAGVAVLTGAGVSAESGMPTFRGAGGIWDDEVVARVATPRGFAADPEGVWDWYNQRRTALKSLRPNPGHVALVELERRLEGRGGWFVLATQNIDALHQAAGSRHVLELHGSLHRMRCSACDYRQQIGLEPVEAVPSCPRCRHAMRPDVVWFGELLPADAWSDAARAARTCQVFLSVGTSGVVYPAAGLVELAAQAGATIIEVNLEPTLASPSAQVALHGKAGEILPRLVA